MFNHALDPEFSPPSELKPLDQTGRALAWLRAHERRVILGGVGLQLLILGLMVGANVVPMLGASTVLLRIVPVDPRDLMRGDYVILGYEIGRSIPSQFQPGATVYVELLPDADGRHMRGGNVTVSPPSSGRFIRGTIGNGGRALFGIESYFVQEGRGKEYEKAIFAHRLSARVAIAADGRAALRGLEYD
ncbi:MAG: GDYXXLXY domain-containing protein [Isosphaeraceae bacterium]